MVRLPVPGSDDGTWGNLLNSFLEVAHNADGTLQGSAVQNAGALMAGQSGVANGVASLNGSALVPTAQLGSGTASSVNFLRGDGAWVTPPGSGAVTSVFTRTGAVTAQSGDYTAAQVGALPSTSDLSAVASANATAGNVSMNTHKITNLANGSAASDAAAFGQVPTSASSIGGLLASNNLSDVADAGSSRAHLRIPTLTPAACVATSNVSLSGFQTIDGYTLASGDLVLLTGQTTASQNGLWTAASGSWTRPSEFAPALTVKGRTCAVLNGTAHANSSWVLNAPTAGITVDTTSQTWSSQSAAGGGSYVAAPGSTANEQGYAPLVLSPSGTPQWGMPWQFNVIGYGAKGDGVCVLDGAMTSGSAVLTCATSTPFTSADVGKAVMVKYAMSSATGTTLCTTIASFQSSSQVTLSASANTTVSAATVLYGTDDTVAFQNAVNAAVTYAQAHSQYAEVTIPPPDGAFYAIAGPLKTGGSTLGNAQITLPIIAPTAAKVTLVLNGGENSAAPRYWDQAYPAFNGSTLVSFGVFTSTIASNTQSQSYSYTNNGNPAVIGGPTGKNGYGVSRSPLPQYSNMLITVKGITVLSPHSTFGMIYSAFNFHGLACANLFDVSYGTIAVVNLAASQTTPSLDDLTTISTFSTTLSIGILMPGAGNNDSSQVRNLICQGGYAFGFFATEHTDIHGLTILYCWSGLCLIGNYGDGGIGIGALHAVHATQLSIEACSYHVNVVGSGTNQPTFFGTLDTEGTFQMRDAASTLSPGNGQYLQNLHGEIHLTGSQSNVNLVGGATYNGTMAKIITDWYPPGPAAAPSFTLGTAQINAFAISSNAIAGWRPATVYASGGTNITAIQVSQYMGGTIAPTMTTIYSQTAGPLPFITFRLSPGQWWVIKSVTPGSDTAPALQWVLD